MTRLTSLSAISVCVSGNKSNRPIGPHPAPCSSSTRTLRLHRLNKLGDLSHSQEVSYRHGLGQR